MNKEIKQLPSEECLIEGCYNWLKEGSRGLCVGHRVLLGERVQSGKVTWEELEKMGLARKKLEKKERGDRQKHPKNEKRYDEMWRKPNQKLVKIKFF